MSISLKISHNLDCCSYSVSRKPGRLIHSTVFLFSQINLAVTVRFSFHINSRINLDISIKNTAGILMGIALNLSINLLRIDLFNRSNLAIHEHNMSPFICLFFLSSVLCHFQYTSPIYVLLDLHLSISVFLDRL